MNKDPDVLTEYVRQALSRHIIRHYVNDENQLMVMMLDRQVEEMLMRNIKQSDQGIMLTIDPATAQTLLGSLEQAIEKWGTMFGTPILACLPAVRGPLHKLTEKFFPSLVVLSHNEIPSNVQVE